MKMLFKLLLLVLILSNTACGAVQLPSQSMAPLVGQVTSVNPGTVVYGIQAALSGEAGAAIYAKESCYLVVWTYRDSSAAGFFSINVEGVAQNTRNLLSGNIANAKSVSELIGSLTAAGWSQVAPEMAPPMLVRLASIRVPVIILTVGTFPGGFEKWFDDSFKPKQVKG
jgi:hypothetical protein